MSGEIRGWADRPAGLYASAGLVLLVVAAPAWLLLDTLANYIMVGDDFLYLNEVRDRPTLLANLLAPHNTHVVPVFRLWTYALYSATGGLAGMPPVFVAAAYFGLVAAMLAVGLLVARETGRPAIALAAMAGLGATTVTNIGVSWYSAGQAIWTGTDIVLTLVALWGWRARGGAWRPALAGLGIALAPWIWSGGFAAGPTAAAYLWFTRRPGSRRLALASLAISVAMAGPVLWLARGTIATTPLVWEQHHELFPRPVQAMIHTAQAIPEKLVVNNFGLDAITTELQGVALTLALAAAWLLIRVAPGRATPLEAAGAALVLVSYAIVFYFRGNLPFASLRAVNWYDLIPQMGAVLFVAGWAGGPRDPGPLTRRGALVVVGLVAGLLVVHTARMERLMGESGPPMSDSERRMFPIPHLQYLRARYFVGEKAERQRRSLARLDRVGQIARREGIGRAAISAAFGRIEVPGMPEGAENYDGLDLLSLPERGPADDPTRVRQLLALYFEADPQLRPPWLPPGDPWPPPQASPRPDTPALRLGR